MSNPLAPSTSSLDALMLQHRTIANNLANASTPGYKRTVNSFAEEMRKHAAIGGKPSHLDEVAVDCRLDFSQGSLVQTGRKLDLALEGRGFFVIETTEGPLYTRNGTFRTDSRGTLVDSKGRAVSGTAGPILLPRKDGLTEVSISADGTVNVGDRRVGELRVVDFADESALQPVGDGCYRAPAEAAPVEADQAVVHSGHKESSNVSTVKELIDLVTVTKLYEANIKAMRRQDERMQTLLQSAM